MFGIVVFYIDAINVRLKTIASYEEKTKELAKIKAEKAVRQKDPEDSREEKAKEPPIEGKEKKKKKVKETAEAAGEGAAAPDQEKAKKKKKVTGETEEATGKAKENE